MDKDNHNITDQLDPFLIYLYQDESFVIVNDGHIWNWNSAYF